MPRINLALINCIAVSETEISLALVDIRILAVGSLRIKKTRNKLVNIQVIMG